MALKAECVAAVSQQIGRVLTKAEQDTVEQAIIQSRTKLARQDIDGYRQMTEAQKIEAAAKDAIASIEHNAYKKKQVETLHIIKTAQNLAEQSAKLKGTRKGGKAGAMHLLDNMRKLEIRQNGLMLNYWRDGVLSAINAIPEKAFGLLHDQKSIDDFVRYLYDKDYNAPSQIKQAVKAWEETTEQMRNHANSAGAEIGKLDYAYLPQLHDVVKMKDKDAWVSFVLQRIDRTRYVDDAGAYIGDVEVAKMLDKAYDQIVTDGLAGRVAEGTVMTGKGGVRGRHDAHRAIHFKGADAHLDYAKQYGKGNLLQVMSSHVHGMTRDIATLEHFGSKPNSTFAQMLDIAKLHDGAIEKSVGFMGVRPTDIYDSLVSGTKTVDAAKAEIWQSLRSIQSAAKLGGALLSSMTDTVSIVGSAWYNGMPARQIANIFKDAPYAAGSKQYKAFAARQGIIADSVISSVNRWAEGEMGYNIASKMADLTFRVSLLNAWTDGLKNAFSVNLSFTLGELTRKADWDGLQKADRYRLEKAGITPDIYNIWRKSELDQWDKHNAALSPKKILELQDVPYSERIEAASILTGYIQGQRDIAVNTSDIIHNGRMNKFAKGDTSGEIARSVMQFKSYPASLLSRQIDMFGDIYHSRGKAPAIMYAVSMITGLSVMGGVAIQAKQLAAGKDPREMDRNFALNAVVQGGGLAFYGDILYTGLTGNSSDTQKKVLSMVAGPLIGSGLELGAVGFEAVKRGATGEDMKDTPAKVIKWLGSNIPVTPMDVWYTRTAFDRLFVDDLMEWASPGYFGRQKGRIMKEYGQKFWWEPTDLTPQRAPDYASDGR